MVDYIPSRGDIINLNFEPQAGKEIAKNRVAQVLEIVKAFLD